MTDKVLVKRTISSTFYVVLVFFLLMGISFAWFSKNLVNTASGMSMEVQTSANLIISTSPEFDRFQFTVSMTSDVQRLLPASHNSDYTASPSGLQKPVDLTQIDYYSGLSPQTGIAMEAVPEENNSQYYKDYIVYVSCRGMALDNATLTAAIEAQESSISENSYLKAASIDFYLNTVDSAGYCGTLNLAGLDMNENHGQYSGITKNDLALLTDQRIPCLQDSQMPNYLKIIMRCYFDGALQNNDTTTFVTSAALDTTAFNLRITFNANGTETEPN